MSTRHAGRTRGLTVLLLGVLSLAGCGRAQNSLLLLDELPDVGTIALEGNTQFNDKTLKGLMALSEGQWWNPFGDHKFRESQLDSDVLAILTFYNRQGYLRTRVSDIQTAEHDGKVDIRITIEEGPRVLAGEVVIMGAREINPNELRRELAVKPEQPLDPFRLDEDRRMILEALADMGHWQARVRANVQFFDDRALVFYRITEGDPVVVDTVRVAGLERVKESLARRDIAVRDGELLRLKDLKQSQLWLLQSDLFVDARWDTTAMDTLRDRVAVDIRLRERKMSRAEAGVGISSQERIRVGGGWSTRNLMGTGSRFGISSRVDLDLTDRLPSPVDEWRTDTFVNIPHAFLGRWELQPSLSFVYDVGVLFVTDTLGTEIGRGEWTQNAAGVSLSTRRVLGSPRNQLLLSIGNRWVFNSADSIAADNDPQLYRESYVTRSLSGRIDLDDRNNFFEPTAGGYYDLFLETAGGALGGNNSFYKGNVGVAQFGLPPRVGPVLAARVLAGYIHAADDSLVGGRPVSSKVQTIPVEDRYFLGGGNTVRGYFQNELDGTLGQPGVGPGGLVQWLTNLEARWRLFGRFGAVGFLDMGNVWVDEAQFTLDSFFPHSDPEKVEPTDVRYSYGLGLRFSTPLGPVRLDYARKWNYLPGEDRDRIHFAIGHAF